MHKLQNLLQDLELLNEEGSNSVLFIDEIYNNKNESNYIEITEKLKILRPDAVYFYNSHPFILFYDFSKNSNDERITTFHQKVWCFDKAPIVFVIEATTTRVYNAFQYLKNVNNGSLKEITEIPFNDIIEKFKFWRLQSGETWQWLSDEVLGKKVYKHRVNQILFNNITKLRQLLTEGPVEQKLTPYDATILILRLIFIRYLIDRDVSIAPYILGYNPIEKRYVFNDIISNRSSLNELFNHLRQRFNNNDLFSKEIIISDRHLQILSYIFKGDFQQNTIIPFMFDIFDFAIIPVETISGIYESVINKEVRRETGAIYTPSFLVNYVFSKTVDEHLKINTECKILDPSCGSGIFLVQSYRKIINRLQKHEVSIDNLIKLAEDNLFGIDRDIDALNVAVFSIYVAILDFISPVEIGNVPLPKLKGKNLFRNDFFNEEDELFDNDSENFDPFITVLDQSKQIKAFDYIIGNPPWGRKNDKIKHKLHLKYIKKHRLPIAGGEISQTFLLRAKDFTGINTTCAFVVTSKAFHNAQAKKFRQHFFKNFKLKSFLDLSIVRRLIFEGGDYPACVVTFTPIYNQQEKKKLIDNIFEHVSLKPSLYLKNFRLPLIGEDDIKLLRQSDAINYDWLLKTALYGNHFDINFIKRLTNERLTTTIESYLLNQKQSFNFGDGIKGGKDAKPFPFLVGKSIIDSSNLGYYYTNVDAQTQVLTERTARVERGRSESLFLGEKVLIRLVPKDEENNFVSYSEKDSVFKHGIIGVSSRSKVDILKGLYGVFVSNLFNYYLFLTSSAWGVARPDVRQEELLSFPCLSEEQLKEISEPVDKLLSLYINYQEIFFSFSEQDEESSLLQKINTLVEKAFFLNPIELDLVNYMQSISRYYFRGDILHRNFLRKTTDVDIDKYTLTVHNHFKFILEDDSNVFYAEIHNLHSHIAVHFKLSSDKSIPALRRIFDESQNQIYKLIIRNFSLNKAESGIFVQRKIMGFETDSFYIIKPNEIRYWHNSTAHKDISEFENAMIKADIKRLEGGNIYV